jgi:hypothetical protein
MRLSVRSGDCALSSVDSAAVSPGACSEATVLDLKRLRVDPRLDLTNGRVPVYMTADR